MNLDATSMHQSAEWGMRSLQSSFPQIKDRFVYEEKGEKRIMLKIMILLYNLQARMVGISQIKNAYMPLLGVDANEEMFFFKCLLYIISLVICITYQYLISFNY